MKQLFTSVGLLGLIACAPSIQSGHIADQRPTQNSPEVIEGRKLGDQLDAQTLSRIRSLNEKAGKPRYGIVGGYYQLPLAHPAGASRVSGDVAGIPYDQTRVTPDRERPWAIAPAPAAEMEMLQGSLNALLDAGVQWTEVSMADASTLISAEKQASGNGSLLDFNKLTPSGVDLLISINKGQGISGPIYVGRVVRSRDGALLALNTQPDAGPVSLRPLIWKLVDDSLRRIVDGQQPETAP